MRSDSEQKTTEHLTLEDLEREERDLVAEFVALTSANAKDPMADSADDEMEEVDKDDWDWEDAAGEPGTGSAKR